MKFNDVLSEAQIDELGILKNIKGGIKNAVAGYKAKKLQNVGSAHSNRIVNNLKAEFQQLVGGGEESTYQNLIDFLADRGLDGLDTIPNPSQPTQSNTSPERIEPTFEDVEGKLSAIQIDNIIKAAVKKNYSRIVAAQQGRTVKPMPQQQAAPEQPDPEQSAPAASSANPVTSPTINATPVAGNVEAIKKAYTILDPTERAELRNQLDIIDDQDRLASGTNESKTLQIRSKFLGIDL